MKKPIFRGVCTALVTPFRDDVIHWDTLDRIVDFQLKNGVTALVLAGTTGESPTLTDTEKYELVLHVKELVGNDCTILAGSGTNSTDHSVELSLNAQAAGADALLVVSPYYNKGNPDGQYHHYKAIAKSVRIPVILYNVPSRTGVDISVNVYKQLAEIANVVGVKEASTDITKISRIRNQCSIDFHFWSGNDDQIVPVISLGGQGVISVLSNVLPYETVSITNAALSGDFERASALQCEYMPIIEALFCEVNPIPVKYAMQCIGFDCGACRLPLGALSSANKNRIDQLLN